MKRPGERANVGDPKSRRELSAGEADMGGRANAKIGKKAEQRDEALTKEKATGR